ncbi:MAG TPA: methyltransferase domain-containing protein [Streptosporangiaceae bacterium]|jgi:SAM-dependent methyltransferase
MGEPLGEAAQRAARAYGAAADHFGLPALGFWDRFGAETVARLGLTVGNTVLDLCCGAGGFDAVICVFGVFFVPEMAAFIAEMWRLTGPGGVLAITTWGPGLFEPANTVFWDGVRVIEPSLFKAFNPWDDITTPQALRDLYARAGVAGADALAVPARHELDSPDRFWDVALGTGYRATIDALSGDQRELLRDRVLGQLRAQQVTTLQTDVVFGTAVRAGERA